ncbi:MAG: IS5 family transposase ISMac15 [Anaerolineales bacterium]|nr:IS5 family transposase ISMac15 [Anaerolineales bacterium]
MVGQNCWMTKSQQSYPTDLNDTQWLKIRTYLPAQAQTGRPREHSWRIILNSIFYILQGGCAWRMLPKEMPPWKTVYHYFRLWRKDGTWERINRLLREKVRLKFGKKRQASASILDSQSAKTSEGGSERGFDAGKKVTGRKRHTLVDTLGLILKVVVTAGNVQDRDGAKSLLEKISTEQHVIKRLELIWADGSYRGELITWVEVMLGWKLEVVEKPKDQNGFQVLPKRWIIERTFAWLVRQRRLARDYERLPETSEAFIYVAMIRLMLRRLATN